MVTRLNPNAFAISYSHKGGVADRLIFWCVDVILRMRALIYLGGRSLIVSCLRVVEHGVISEDMACSTTVYEAVYTASDGVGMLGDDSIMKESCVDRSLGGHLNRMTISGKLLTG